ncbi:type II/IV secretion system protein [Candidatus Uhrbacteria bacterium]|nr:type II/IV secretion system protein [Candidatus Uhrbacteria bacterium]
MFPRIPAMVEASTPSRIRSMTTAPASSTQNPQAQFQAKMADIASKAAERHAQALAERLGLGYIQLEHFPITPEALALIAEGDARAWNVVPIYRTINSIRVAAFNPELPEVQALIATLNATYHAPVEVLVTSEASLERSWKLYATLPKIREIKTGLTISEADLAHYTQSIQSFHDLHDQLQKVSTTEQVTLVIAGAMQTRASDIHIEAAEKEVLVRYRIDGMLHDAATLPKEAWKQLIARLKLLATLKLNVMSQPQDGRFTIEASAGNIDVRVSTLPTAFGESVVIRLLMSNISGYAFEDLGVRGIAYEQLKKEIERPNGMIITTGPTGSGKTTTLYAIVNKLNRPEVKIITIEDPIEYHLKGINQSQVDPRKGYTFAEGMRSIVRQDPDVVMVGEIRDLETAETTIQAALTGHLVLSTIHTNSAAGSIPRLLSLGAKPFLVAPALNAMIGQRLVRRICTDCKEVMTLAEDALERAKKTLETLSPASGSTVDWATAKFYRGKGCDACQNLGYKGRIGIYEIMVMNKEIEKLILSGSASEYDFQDAAMKVGMVTMIQDGLLKALDGITTVDEVFRVSE